MSKLTIADRIQIHADKFEFFSRKICGSAIFVPQAISILATGLAINHFSADNSALGDVLTYGAISGVILLGSSNRLAKLTSSIAKLISSSGRGINDTPNALLLHNYLVELGNNERLKGTFVELSSGELDSSIIKDLLVNASPEKLLDVEQYLQSVSLGGDLKSLAMLMHMRAKLGINDQNCASTNTVENAPKI